MKSRTKEEFKDPENISYGLISDEKTLRKLNSGELPAKPVKYKDINGIPEKSSCAAVQFNDSGILKSKSIHHSGNIDKDTLFSADNDKNGNCHNHAKND